ncbi:ABC transporter ATP-binding protein [Atopobacter sp. AH10]|uniref:ABC transporter ATP-binding protein n=1 Tax=Atopobacter sp. AH10 TaxID=2315861 RepID=UPI000EF18930|nr:ABC transporter ATP-binding protein [Atopobacter sp. AH10]RLK63468.1 ABC transporter ATP-binding protein [Atopobacter sp. AH10]
MLLLEAEQLSKSYQGQLIISDISIQLLEGEIVALLGTSGVGKTTLFNCLAGSVQADKGHVYLKGKDITGQTGHFSYMLQKDLLFEQMKMIDNVSLPLQISGMKKKEAREIAQSYFKQFGLEGREMDYPNQLSGGMRQRAAFLRTYLASGSLMLLDEPFSALDSLTKEDIYYWYLKTSARYKLSTLFITHSVDEAITLSDRIYVMKGRPGKIIGEFLIEAAPDRQSFALTKEFLDYKKAILEAIQS